jgi:hypothetical protein
MELEKYDGYITLTEGMDFRSIAKQLENIDIHYKHATVRNITEKATKEFLEHFINIVGFDETKIDKESVLRTKSFYDNLMEIMSKVTEAHPELIKNTLKEIEDQTKTNER